MSLARKVKLRPWREYHSEAGGPETAAYVSFREEMTFRWAVICQVCYRILDNDMGLGEIGCRRFNLAGASRGDRAVMLADAKYLAFQRREAAKLGLDL